MRQIDEAEPQYALGEPVNRKPAPKEPVPWAPEFWQRAMKP